MLFIYLYIFFLNGFESSCYFSRVDAKVISLIRQKVCVFDQQYILFEGWGPSCGFSARPRPQDHDWSKHIWSDSKWNPPFTQSWLDLRSDCRISTTNYNRPPPPHVLLKRLLGMGNAFFAYILCLNKFPAIYCSTIVFCHCWVFLNIFL